MVETGWRRTPISDLGGEGSCSMWARWAEPKNPGLSHGRSVSKGGKCERGWRLLGGRHSHGIAWRQMPCPGTCMRTGTRLHACFEVVGEHTSDYIQTIRVTLLHFAVCVWFLLENMGMNSEGPASLRLYLGWAGFWNEVAARWRQGQKQMKTSVVWLQCKRLEWKSTKGTYLVAVRFPEHLPRFVGSD